MTERDDGMDDEATADRDRSGIVLAILLEVRQQTRADLLIAGA